MRTQCLVSIIIVNWNGASLLNDCLSSLTRQTYSPYEIILVDNGSIDGSVDLILENFPQIKLVQLSENQGFAGGNIKGWERSRGEFVALLNNDTRVDEYWLENLVKPMDIDSSVGICASMLLVESTGKIDSAGDCLTTWAVGFKRGFGRESYEYSDQEEVFGACAAASLYRREMIEDIGFFDEDFFFNDEDTDLNFRAQLAGWKCIFVPFALVYHKVNATIGKCSDRHVYFHVRNLEFLWIKNMPLGLMLRYAHHKIFHEIGHFLYICLRHGKWNAYIRGKNDAFRMLPIMLNKRREIQRKRKVNNQTIKALLTPIFSRELIAQKIKQFMKG